MIFGWIVDELNFELIYSDEPSSETSELLTTLNKSNRVCRLVVCAAGQLVPVINGLRYRVGNEKQKEVKTCRRACGVHLLAPCRHTQQHETQHGNMSVCERAVAQRVCCSFLHHLETHTHTHTHTQSHCNNSTLFIITGPSTVAVLTKPLWVVLDRGVSDFPEASAAGGCIPVISTCSVMYMTVVKTGRVSDLWWLIDGTLMPFALARTEKVVSEFYWQKHNYCLIVWVTFWSDLIWKSVRVTLQTCSCKLMKWFCVRNHFFFWALHLKYLEKENCLHSWGCNDAVISYRLFL